ncbi:putative squalene/phytoene synthase [Nocardia nova SH22a]|uniref:Putative squalene/phytoene synthase n=1 Tax=Nocardia nova SH22a TaxID=1415166 RepID=W5TM59_9NOCA|nr:squalene synthase HpnC [Nocardia nova]AHH20337.1 putative squalene/phytoene synthase [Nocardia nova SH22a]
MDAATAPARWLRAREKDENFPVALRWLPREPRRHLHAVYATTRLIDQIGDAAPGDRVSQLEALRADLAGLWQGRTPADPILQMLAPTVAACELPQDAFEELIEANLIDQRVGRYATFDDLLGYCRLSANPVGRLVLAVFDQSTPETIALSDQVCSALQVLEHCQDVAEDFAADRIYLPQLDLTEAGVAEASLATGGPGDPACRAVVLTQVDRCETLLDAGAPLVARLTGWARIAVSGYIAGGCATVRALRIAEGDVWTEPVRPRHVDTVASMVTLLGKATVVPQ